MINSVNPTNNNYSSKVAFGSVLKMCPTSYCERYFKDMVELEKRMSSDGIDGEIVLKKIISPKSNPILAALSDVPKFILDVKAKINESIAGLASKTYRKENSLPINNDISVEMRVGEEELFHGTSKIFSKANDIASDVERRIETPAFQVKPEQLADYRETVLMAADSSYNNAILKYAERLAGNTEELTRTGKPFSEAIKEAETKTFEEMLSEDKYEISASQVSTAKAILNSVWAYGDKIV